MNCIQSIIHRVSYFFERVKPRTPSKKFVVLGLSGSAVMVWTPEGNIVVTQETANTLARKLDRLAEILENKKDEINNHD
jgi:hypothetical protein